MRLASEKDNRTALTALAIRRMKVGQQLSDVGENSGLRVTASAKDRQFWYRFNHPKTGRETALHMGYSSEMSLSEARAMFTCLKQQRRAGRIPVVPGAESLDADSYTISRMISDYIDEGVARRRNEKSTDACAILIAGGRRVPFDCDQIIR